MMAKVIKLATDFTRFPYGRYRAQGPFSGEAFREQFLVDAIRNGEELEVDFDGTSGLSPSFLEEAFGGLVRRGIDPDRIFALLRIKSDEDPSYIIEVRSYVRDAAAVVH